MEQTTTSVLLLSSNTKSGIKIIESVNKTITEKDRNRLFKNRRRFNVYVLRISKENFKPGDRDKFTIVIWLEGDDPDCVDSIIGGELKLEMNITDEHIKEKGE